LGKGNRSALLRDASYSITASPRLVVAAILTDAFF
jgi:hypothetical protein